jgi:hypothetical protein
MNSETYQPEPWLYRKMESGQWGVFTGNSIGNQLVASCLDEGTARRIAACVNACDGLSTRGLENRGVPDVMLVMSETAFFLQNLTNEMDEDGSHKPTITILKHNLKRIGIVLEKAFKK